MQKKRDHFRDLMTQTRFQPLASHGSYFQIYSYREISDAPDFSFAKDLVAHHGVASIPVSVFYQSAKDDKVLRFCFAKKDETLEAAAEKLSRV
jgi:methionine aminotransferase